MRAPVVAPFTLYCEEQVRDLIGHVDGHVTRFWGESVPLDIFVNDLWQSATREGYIEGHVQAQRDNYRDMRGHEPSVSVVGDWRKKAGKKAFGA